MHTHFGSATQFGTTMLNILLGLTLWRLAWLHVMSIGTKRGNKTLQGFARAGLFQG